MNSRDLIKTLLNKDLNLQIYLADKNTGQLSRLSYGISEFYLPTLSEGNTPKKYDDLKEPSIVHPENILVFYGG